MGKIGKYHTFILVIISVHLLLLSGLIFFPYPELMVYSYLTDNGMIPFTQIFDQHFPGMMFFPVNLAALGINDPVSLKYLHLVLIAINHILIYYLGILIFNNKSRALSSNLIYLLFQPYYEGNVMWIESFVTPLILVSAIFLMKDDNSKRGLLLSGAFVGMSLIFKQVVAPLIIMIFIYLLLRKKRWVYFVVGVSAVSSLLIWFVIHYSNITDFIYWTYTFNVTTFSRMGRKYPEMFQLFLSLPIIAPLLFAGLVSLFSFSKEDNNKFTNRNIILLLIFSFGTAVFAYARFDYIHLQPLIPFTSIIITYLLYRSSHLIKYAVIFSVFVSCIYLLPGFYKAQSGDDVRFFGETEKILAEAVNRYSSSDESIFAMATTPHIYYLTDRMPPGDVFVFQFPWFMVEVEDEILNGILMDPPTVVIRDPYASVQGMNLVSYMPEIDKYISDNYEVVDNYQGIEIMINK